jgi:hypothetical protein
VNKDKNKDKDKDDEMDYDNDKPFGWGDVVNGHDNGHEPGRVEGGRNEDSGDELALSAKGWEEGASGHVSVVEQEDGLGQEDAEGEEEEDDGDWGQEDAEGEDDDEFVG